MRNAKQGILYVCRMTKALKMSIYPVPLQIDRLDYHLCREEASY